ncbi:acylphosphatase-1-like isoform X2 [Varroa jacobsoni]|uniref:acylphosphatase-1-like isoform X2 n=1 Tax=Varroa jacobsoni TaxID=62625 RepID=UPI000BF98C1D|nr:acylphosphatase-1-like isoform X2 [Varroa jacobsoni]
MKHTRLLLHYPKVGREQSRKMVFRAASFECFGKVQGVFFRKYTQKEATSLGVVGWIRNTSRDTVEGEIQGPAEAFDKMKIWLRTTGSPQSQIDNAEFTNEKDIPELQFNSFEIRKNK